MMTKKEILNQEISKEYMEYLEKFVKNPEYKLKEADKIIEKLYFTLQVIQRDLQDYEELGKIASIDNTVFITLKNIDIYFDEKNKGIIDVI